jgi:parvulin-like peptidyl-prolyl isomerase
VRSGTGYHLLQLVEHEPPRTPELQEIENQVRSEWQRRAGDRALRSYLDELRERADIVVPTELP